MFQIELIVRSFQFSLLDSRFSFQCCQWHNEQMRCAHFDNLAKVIYYCLDNLVDLFLFYSNMLSEILNLENIISAFSFLS